MKNKIMSVSFCLSMLFSTVVFGQVKMFEQKNLVDWAFHVDKEGVKVEDVFSFTADGVLACKGEPFGWLGTKENHKNFKLAVEYRWPEGVKPTNSGIFLRLNHQKKDTFLPRTVEVQLAHGNAGDLWGFHGMKLPAPPACEAARISGRDGGEKLGVMMGVKKTVAAEKEPGQWNVMEILCSEGLIVVVLNGKIVNWVTDAEQTPGKIGFQSEGGPVEFRNAILTALP